jgi:hypothetical protein
VSSKVRLRDAYSIPTVSYVHHFPVSAGVWSRPDTRGVITSATTRYERMSDKVNLRGSACTIAGTPGRKQDMVRHLRITNFRYVYCSLPHSCSRAHTRGTKTLFLRELLGFSNTCIQALSVYRRVYRGCIQWGLGEPGTTNSNHATHMPTWRSPQDELIHGPELDESESQCMKMNLEFASKSNRN